MIMNKKMYQLIMLEMRAGKQGLQQYNYVVCNENEDEYKEAEKVRLKTAKVLGIEPCCLITMDMVKLG